MDREHTTRSPIVVLALGGFGLLVAIMLKRLAVEAFGSLDEAMIRVLAVDTAEPSTYLESDEYGVTADDLELIGPETFRIGIETGPGFSIESYPLLARWVPRDVWPVLSDPLALSAGAKAIRSLSALSLYWNHRPFIDRLMRTFSGLYTTEMIDRHKSVARQTKVMIVGSAAGGTGSGTLIPVGYEVQDLMEGGRGAGDMSITAIIGMPEIFQSANPKLGANTYQLLKELNYYSRSDTVFLAPIDGARPNRSRPFHNTVLVSRTNGSIELRDKEEAAELIANQIILDATA